MDFLEVVDKKVESLAPLPETIIKIQEICSNPKSNVNDLTKVIQQDPILCSKILKIANSPYYGFTSRITSINHAISLLGMNTILGFAIDTHVKKNFKKIDLSPYCITPEDYKNSSNKQCRLMMLWHFNLGIENSDFLITSSFLNEIGKILLAQIIIEKNLKEEFIKKINGAEVIDDIFNVEKEFFGINCVEVTGKIFYRWRLNIKMVYSILASIEPEKADKELYAYGYALKIVRTVVGQKGNITRDLIDRALQLIEKAGFNKRSFLVALNSVIE